MCGDGEQQGQEVRLAGISLVALTYSVLKSDEFFENQKVCFRDVRHDVRDFYRLLQDNDIDQIENEELNNNKRKAMCF